MKQQQMTAEQAMSFERGISMTSVLLLTAEAERRGCGCVPYTDWYTYRRWQALGYQVQKGEKGFRLAVFREVEDREGKTRSIPWSTTVFCKCQVKPMEDSSDEQ